MIRAAFLLTFVANVTMAQDLSQEFLEQEGMVWVATDFPEFSKEYRMDFLIPYLTFTDGQLESGFLAGYPSIYQNACDDLYTCPTRTTRGHVMTGPYSVGPTSIEALHGTTVSDWRFGEGDRHDLTLDTNGMHRGYVEMERRGDWMFQETVAGPRDYVLLPETLIHAPFHLAEFADQPVELAYQCSLEHIFTLSTTPADARTERQNQLQSLLNVLAVQVPADQRITVLDGIRNNATLTAEQRQELDELESVDSITISLDRLMASLFKQSEDSTSGLPELIDGPISQQAIDQENTIMKFTVIRSAPNPSAAQALFDELMPDMISAAPLAAQIKNGAIQDIDGSAIGAVLCSE